MKRYEKFADDIAELIRTGVLGPGQRVPSVRYASQTYGVSLFWVLFFTGATYVNAGWLREAV